MVVVVAAAAVVELQTEAVAELVTEVWTELVTEFVMRGVLQLVTEWVTEVRTALVTLALDEVTEELELIDAVGREQLLVWAPGMHWEYHGFWTTHELPVEQHVGPVQPRPPHRSLFLFGQSRARE